MTPWISYGQSYVPFNTGIDNPPANTKGALGEVQLPYVVPDGKVLVLAAFGVEAYADEAGLQGTDKGLVIVPWIGNGPPTNADCLHSVYAGDGFNESVGARYHLPTGTKLNVRLMCAENPAQVIGWYLSGHLEDAS